MMIALLLLLVAAAVPANWAREVESSSDSCDEKKFGYLCKFQEDCGESGGAYIINGSKAGENEFPSFAQIFVRPTTTCSGVLISDYHVLTAAHCLEGIKNIARSVTVILGNSTLEQGVVWGTDLPHYNFPAQKCYRPTKSHRGDIVVIRLNNRVKFSKNIQPACWPTDPTEVRTKGRWSYCYQVGRGIFAKIDGIRYSPSHLLKMRIVEQTDDCNMEELDESDSYKYKARCFKNAVRDQRVCHGDSGGPSLCKDSRGKWTVMGVLSGGRSCDVDSWFLVSGVDEELALTTSGKCAPQEEEGDDR